uniref:Uncharacterized protein n=1 Tax=Magallana gigas TaxID=29159 RepID=K1QHB7_MAGGI
MYPSSVTATLRDIKYIFKKWFVLFGAVHGEDQSLARGYRYNYKAMKVSLTEAEHLSVPRYQEVYED